MTGRQRVLKIVYPVWIALTKLMGRNTKILANAKNIKPAQSIYDLSVSLNNGNSLPLQSFRGKKLLLVNTASNCGYTNQYEDLQKLYQQFNNQLQIIAFPANDFKEQEKGSDTDIAQFCQVNFGVTFPLAKKSVVIPSGDQNNVFQWLTDKSKNGWNEQSPSWNFSKYLVNEQGTLTHYFDPSVSPLSSAVINAVLTA
ncbi:glutathione peroxidase [Niastella vici]|uniref:Glutathione peroxidase n=1 Tax=Niastella vici TaxID=1703345 RepID=A0A1V9G977_9BACT|nr:glutathione peroxidase [Niastella vici]OQP67028.1 glutathione peroxidase [Niastella vici]